MIVYENTIDKMWRQYFAGECNIHDTIEQGGDHVTIKCTTLIELPNNLKVDGYLYLIENNIDTVDWLKDHEF